ncbi:MAG: PAS domain-containing protein [Desulfobacterales bacterium]|nr:PAS domain-containing protein [Desulfobacterales bacterium]
MTHSKSDPKDISIDALYGFINDFPALLWRIEILKARIMFFNDNTDVAPGVDGSLLMKNDNYRNQALLPEDIRLFEIFMESVKEGKTAATVFRVKNGLGKISWLKLTGAVNRRDPAYYYGYLLNADDTVSVIKGVLDTDLELRLIIEDAENPVFLIDYESATLVCANASANRMFGLTETDYRHLSFESLYWDISLKPLDRILNKLPLTRKWHGRLTFQSRNKKTLVKAEAVFRFLVHKKTKLVRVSLQAPVTSPAPDAREIPSQSADLQSLEKAVRSQTDITGIMEACLASPLAAGRYDAILFSDVYVRKNKVKVYGAGPAFSGMPGPETFSYKGTIAEDIIRYALDWVVVDDTQDSIKPIDWALFIPMGIRSYFAVPFYSRSVLRTVLIFCSTRPGRFTDQAPEEFSDMLGIMNNAIRNWRRSCRS